MIDGTTDDLESQQQDDLQGRRRKAGRKQDRSAAAQADQVQAEQHQQPRLHGAKADVELAHPAAEMVVVKDGAEVLVQGSRLGGGGSEVRHPVGGEHGVEVMPIDQARLDLVLFDA